MAHASASGESGLKYASRTSAIAAEISLFIFQQFWGLSDRSNF